MSSANNNSLVAPNFFNTSNDGNKFKHNFTNRYLSDDDLRKPSREIADAITEVTKKDLLGRVAAKNDTAHSGAKPSGLMDNDVQYIKYTPNQQGDGHNAGATQRMIKMHTVKKDPLAPAQFKHKKIPKGPGSPPVTVMHSPPRKLTLKDQQDWRVPPCISNWKNAKGFTIPLEMRLSADGRTLQENTISEKFAKLADSFYIAERQSRQDIEERNKIQKQMAYKEYLKKEEDMRQQAAFAREEKNKIYTKDTEEDTGKRRNPYVNREEEEAKQERDQIRYIAKREVERERRIEVAQKKKSKTARDADRDVSEKIALGQAQPTAQEVMYDQRLFNQTAGMDSGFGDEDEYHAFDKPLFADKTSRSIYGAVKEVPEDEPEGQDNDDKKKVNKVLASGQSNKGFEGGAENKGTRNKPVEFEKHDDDLFGLDSFLEPTKKVKK